MAMVEGQPNEALVYDLSREGGTNYLRRLNEQFDGLSYIRSAHILWAYETEESPTVIASDGYILFSSVGTSTNLSVIAPQR